MAAHSGYKYFGAAKARGFGYVGVWMAWGLGKGEDCFFIILPPPPRKKPKKSLRKQLLIQEFAGQIEKRPASPGPPRRSGTLRDGDRARRATEDQERRRDWLVQLRVGKMEEVSVGRFFLSRFDIDMFLHVLTCFIF